MWYPSALKGMKDPTTLHCSKKKNWVLVNQGRIIILEEATTTHGTVICYYTPILRGKDDGEAYFGDTTFIRSYDLIKSDAFMVNCSAADGSVYSNIHSSVMWRPELHARYKKHLKNIASMDLDIVMVGFDSISRMTWMRNLPKTHRYFTKELGGLVFEGYNVVGYNTRRALSALLTGRDLDELPEVRLGFKGAQYVDSFPWLFRELQSAGYVTQWGEDDYESGTFTKALRGFKDQPVDHYLRPFHMKLPKVRYDMLSTTYCLGPQPKHQVVFQNILDLYDMYGSKPKFSFMWNTELSHDSLSMVRLVDDDLKSFLQKLKHTNLLNNTLLILLSDHGARFGEPWDSPQGGYEQLLPYLGLRFPKWFEQKYPVAYKNLQKNTVQLTTPYDVHATLKDVLNYTGSGKQNTGVKALSLFQEVPINRSCGDAGISSEWCTCLDWQKLPSDHENAYKAAINFVDAINAYTEPFRNICHSFQLLKVTNALEYKGNWDWLLGHFGERGHKDKGYRLYKIEVRVQPGTALFETTIAADITAGIFVTKKSNINRINTYGNESACIEYRCPDLYEYCYCRSWFKEIVVNVFP